MTIIRRAGSWSTCPVAVALVAGFAISSLQTRPQAASPESPAVPRFKAIAFDYTVLFNPDSIVPEVKRVFPGKERELTTLWRTRQFEYSWLRSITNHYVDFLQVTEDSLVYAAEAMKLELKPDDKQRLLDAYLHLTPWPDAADGLRKLKAAGLRIITIANFSPMMLRSNADNAHLTEFFDDLLSTDVDHVYKPDPRAYQLGVDRLHLAKQEILFAAFGGWDAAGAKSFGYPTFWVNRFNQPVERLGVLPDGTSMDMEGLLKFVLSGPPAQNRPRGM